MLVLARKLEESVMIGSEIEVKILGIQGDVVRLGFSAPRQVPVFRKEVFEEIQAENKLAASPDAMGLADIAASMRRDARARETNSKRKGGFGK
jgi:carbon storage regulator